MKIKAAFVGQRVRPIFNLTDIDGSSINTEEMGVIELVTRNTIHVRDVRGHLHKRYAYFFTAESIHNVTNEDCIPTDSR